MLHCAVLHRVGILYSMQLHVHMLIAHLPATPILLTILSRGHSPQTLPGHQTAAHQHHLQAQGTRWHPLYRVEDTTANSSGVTATPGFLCVYDWGLRGDLFT